MKTDNCIDDVLLQRVVKCKIDLFNHKVPADDRNFCGVFSVGLKEEVEGLENFELVSGRDKKGKHHSFLINFSNMIMLDASAGQYGQGGLNGVYIGSVKSPHFGNVSSIKRMSKKLYDYYYSGYQIFKKYEGASREEIIDAIKNPSNKKEEFILLKLLN